MPRPWCDIPTIPPPTADGVLVVDKPRGPTSHDLVAAVRRWTKRRDVGHAGTLDPMATGVLLILIGEATKLSSYLTLEDKRYAAEVSLGRSTDTWDAEGSTTASIVLDQGWLDPAALATALAAERARTAQVPPVFSAIKVGGRAAHRLSRAGRPPDLEPRPVAIRNLRLLHGTDATLALELVVSKGYYVRSLARDLGERLGVPAHLSQLRRLASGPFTCAEAVPWPPDAAVSLLATGAAAGRALPKAILTEEGTLRARLGQGLALEHFVAGPGAAFGVTAWLTEPGELVALGAQNERGEFRVVRGFSTSPVPGRTSAEGRLERRPP
ncbi:MAG: tRNA pseudouridine(55) synthase TruB [Polyangiaceae bacterium]|nr:tRNA pseudouridine(55) synthase TruB [Polyangiaceae bacterium]